MEANKSHLSKRNKEKKCKIEKAHRAKDNKSGNNLHIIAKFTDWNFSEEIKSSFVPAAKNGIEQIPIIVSQMYTPA